jgi:HKD family nuclease
LRTRFVNQPFGPAGNPQTLGELLTAEIRTHGYRNLEFRVAFATSSGTSRLFGPIREFVQHGGTAVVNVGLSNGVTSAQACEQLLLAGASVFGFETGGSVLFHPKIYLLRAADRVWVSIGSSNLTADGLYRNFEANTVTTCDPRTQANRAALRELTDALDFMDAIQGASRRITAPDLPDLIASNALLDETLVPLPQRVPSVLRTTRRAHGEVVRIRVPAAPPPHPDLGTVRRPARAAAAAPAAAPVVARALQTRYFAMTLSEFDTSHRRGVRGTPEISLPEESVAFFPATQMQGRQYPDAYFEVLLNERAGSAKTVRYRIWQRPPGAAVGHADWRINVGHDTIDQTRPAAGDILLFERLPDGSTPAYEVWVVHPTDPEHARLTARCTNTVQARGRGGVKRWGLF